MEVYFLKIAKPHPVTLDNHATKAWTDIARKGIPGILAIRDNGARYVSEYDYIKHDGKAPLISGAGRAGSALSA